MTKKKHAKYSRSAGFTIRVIRDYFGLKASEFIIIVGITRGELQRYETGMEIPSIEVLKRVRSRLGVSIGSYFQIAESIERGLDEQVWKVDQVKEEYLR